MFTSEFLNLMLILRLILYYSVVCPMYVHVCCVMIDLPKVLLL